MLSSKEILTIIPARLASSRLPNKPLANILGKTMIQRVYEQAKKANLGEILIACDGQEIAREAEKFGANYVLTNPDLPSGTDRIFAAYQEFKNKSGQEFDIIVNLQGDLPAIDPKVIKAAALTVQHNDCDIATVASKMFKKEEVQDPNIVKIAIAFKKEETGQALYFSRCPIPYDQKEGPDLCHYHHIGIYAYKAKALEKFVGLEVSELEKRESLEQLRALENGQKIMVKIVDSHPISVDTQEDLNKLINTLNE